jgi:hypothetical protein
MGGILAASTVGRQDATQPAAWKAALRLLKSRPLRLPRISHAPSGIDGGLYVREPSPPRFSAGEKVPEADEGASALAMLLVLALRLMLSLEQPMQRAPLIRPSATFSPCDGEKALAIYTRARWWRKWNRFIKTCQKPRNPATPIFPLAARRKPLARRSRASSDPV